MFRQSSDILAHPCGQYVLNALQSGVPADEVRAVLFREYLVQTPAAKLQAYRRTCEQNAGYWTLEHLELHHWHFLYEQTERWKQPRRPERLLDIRERLCDRIELAEELIPLSTMQSFYRKHHATARMPLQYPGCAVVKDALPRRVIDAYRRELRGRTLPGLGSRCVAMFGCIIATQVFGKRINISSLVLSCKLAR